MRTAGAIEQLRRTADEAERRASDCDERRRSADAALRQVLTTASSRTTTRPGVQSSQAHSSKRSSALSRDVDELEEELRAASADGAANATQV